MDTSRKGRSYKDQGVDATSDEGATLWRVLYLNSAIVQLGRIGRLGGCRMFSVRVPVRVVLIRLLVSTERQRHARLQQFYECGNRGV